MTSERSEQVTIRCNEWKSDIGIHNIYICKEKHLKRKKEVLRAALKVQKQDKTK